MKLSNFVFKTSFAVTYSLSGKHMGEYSADCLILPVVHVMSGDPVGHRWQSSLPFLRCGAQTLHKYFPPQKHVRQLCSTDPGYKKHLSGFPPLPAALWRHKHIKTGGMINDALSHECWLSYSAAGKKKNQNNFDIFKRPLILYSEWHYFPMLVTPALTLSI